MSADFNFLTSKQKKVYSAIETFINTKGIPPTVREIGKLVGEKTPGAVQGILNRLEQKGVIKRELGMARSIQLVMGDSLYSKPVYVPEIKKVNKRYVDNLLNIYNINKYVPLPADFVDENGEFFIFSCPDHGLADKGINFGDILLFQKNAPLSDGDIVLAVYENYTLLRQYYSIPNSKSISLKTDIDILNKETFESTEVQIIGKVLGLYRKL